MDLERLKEVCLSSSSNGGVKETEITEICEPTDDGDYGIVQKVQHETKSNKNLQNDMIIYDIVKLLIIALLEQDTPEEAFVMDFGTALAINTLISWGILVEV